MSEQTETPSAVVRAARPTSRRTVVGGVLGAGVGVPLLAACGSGSSSGAPGDAAGSTTASGPVTTTSEVPVGGGVILSSKKVVVTQPAEGDFKAFSAVCTHQQCLVTSVKDQEINCSCHGSRFSISDGSVLGGPAKEPLPEMKVTVAGNDVSVS